MKEMNDIDRLFKDALYTRESSYDAADWKDMEQLLDNHRPSQSSLPWRIILPSLLFILTGVGIWLASQTSAVDVQASSREQIAVNSEPLATVNIHEPSDSDLPPVSILMEDQTSGESDAIAVNLTKNHNITEKVTMLGNSSDNDMDKGPKLALINAEIETNYSSDLSEKASEEERIPTSSEEEKNTLAEKDDLAPSYSGSVVNMITTEPTSHAGSEETVSEIDIPVVSSKINKEGIDSELPGNSETTSPSSSAVTSVSDEVLTTDSKEQSATELPVTAEEPEVDPDKLRNKEVGLSGWKLIATGGYTTGVSAETGRYNKQYAYGLGIGYEKKIHPNFSVEFRLLNTRRDAGGIQYNVQQTFYDFDVHNNNFQYRYSSLSMVEIPVLVNYLFLAKHQIGLGLQYNRLVYATYDYNISGTTSGDHNDYNGQGSHVKGIFNSSDYGVACGYQYLWTDRLKVGLHGQFGLTNLVNQSYLPGADFRNHQLRLLITYKLFD